MSAVARHLPHPRHAGPPAYGGTLKCWAVGLAWAAAFANGYAIGVA